MAIFRLLGVANVAVIIINTAVGAHSVAAVAGGLPKVGPLCAIRASRIALYSVIANHNIAEVESGMKLCCIKSFTNCKIVNPVLCLVCFVLGACSGIVSGWF